MLTGATVNEQPKSISAVKPKREGGHARAKKRRGGHNVIWKRMTATFDELKKHGANPALVSPVTRWVVYGHLTNTQGLAGLRYASIVRSFERYCLPAASRTARSANLEPTAKGEDDEIERRISHGTLPQYESDARHAKRQYKRLSKVMAHFADPITGRNLAKDNLDTLCLAEQEPAAQLRPDIAVVLQAIAKEFGIGIRRRKIQ